MFESVKKETKVEVAPPSEKKELPKEPSKKEAKKEVPKAKLPMWNFPLKQRSVRAKNLQEAIKKVNAKE